jgi:predicted nucleic acid-binding protein
VSVSVVVDTNVFTAGLRKDRSLEALYAKHVGGRRVAVAPQTIAEARCGALSASWGSRRRGELDHAIARARLLPVDGDLIDTVVHVRNECPLEGHAFRQALHRRSVDRRQRDPLAAPLVAHDAVFIGCPGLDLRTELVD